MPSAAAPAPPPLLRPRWPGAWALAMGRDVLGFVTAVGQHGDLVRVRAAGRTIVVASHPDLARDVLVTQHRAFGRGLVHRGMRAFLGDGLLTSEDPTHRRQRRLAQPAFHRDRVAGYARAMVDAAERWNGRWAAAAGGGAHEVDVATEMSALTLGIAGETLFGAQVEGAAAVVADALAIAMRAAPFAFLPFSTLILASPLPAARRVRAARDRIDAVIHGIIADRRRQRAAGADAGRDDLLAMLLEATDPEPDAGDDAGDGAAAPMSDQQLRDEVLTIFLAGHETTASALAWTWHLLSAHPGVAATLGAELDAVLGDGAGDTRPPTFDDLPRLVYTRQVVQEAMRLYPPAYAIGRLCVEPTVLGGCRIERGWAVVTSPWLAHRDPRWWPAPLEFRPERWATPDPARPKFAYFPFGGGPRLCIGEQFAWTEAVLVLAALARRWTVRPAPGSPITPRGTVTLRPTPGVRVVVAPRRAEQPRVQVEARAAS